jgi:hypothetical protein
VKSTCNIITVITETFALAEYFPEQVCAEATPPPKRTLKPHPRLNGSIADPWTEAPGKQARPRGPGRILQCLRESISNHYAMIRDRFRLLVPTLCGGNFTADFLRT